jgi:hypothetical protein
VTTEPLQCAECGKVAVAEAEGWKAEIADDPRDDDAPEVVILCPECWAREFGDFAGPTAVSCGGASSSVVTV